MEKLLTVDDVASALQVCRRTAYTYMEEMIHLDRPRRVSECSFRAWMLGRTAGPEDSRAHGKGKKKTPVMGLKIALMEDFKIPRRKEA